MKWLINKNITSSFAIASGMLLLISIGSYLNLLKLRDSTKWVEHTHLVLKKSEELLSNIQEAGMQQREYLLTSREHYLQEYYIVIDRINQSINGLQLLTIDNPNQQKRINAIKPLIAARVQRLNQTINVQKQEGMVAALRKVQISNEKQLLNKTKEIIKDIEAEENNLLKQRTDKEERIAKSTATLLGSGSFFTLIVVAWASWLVNRDIIKRQQEQQALRQYADIFENAELGLAIADKDAEYFKLVNSAFAVMHGYKLAELLEQPIINMFAPECRTEFAQGLQTVKQKGHYSYESKHIRKDGSIFPVQIDVTLVEDKYGACIYRIANVQDITERKQVEQALKDSEERFRQLAENIREVFWIDSLDRQQLYVSPAYEQVWCQSRESLYANPDSFIDSIHPEDRERVINAQKKQIAGEYDEEYRIIRPDGEIRWIRDRAFPIQNEQAEIYRIVGIAEDISDRKQLEAMLRQQAEQLAQANRMKDEFLAVTSHELRTPLGAILTWSQLLRKRNLDPATTARALETIERNAKSQNQLIEDLVDISRIVRGKIRLDLSNISLIEIIKAAVDTLSSSATAKAIQLESNLIPAECTVYGDSMRLQQVILNLLSNAIKFTPQGGRVEVRLSLVGRTAGVEEWESGGEQNLKSASGSAECYKIQNSKNTSQQSPIQNPKSKSVEARSTIQNLYAQIQVIDTGIGIEAKFLPYIFERFSQADGSSIRGTKGLGLGLAIAHQIVELHGGTIEAESPGVGQGTTFTIYLPVIAQTSAKFTDHEQYH